MFSDCFPCLPEIVLSFFRMVGIFTYKLMLSWNGKQLKKSPANEVQRIRSIGDGQKVVLSAYRTWIFGHLECGWILVHGSRVKFDDIGYF